MSATPLNKATERLIRRGTTATSICDIELLQHVWGGKGEVLRVELEGAKIDSVVVKRIMIPPGANKKKRKDKGLARTLSSYDNELQFYRDFAPQLCKAINVPQCFEAQKLGEEWAFILEDLSLREMTPPGGKLGIESIRSALDWLAGFHANFLNQPIESLWKNASYWNLTARQEDWKAMENRALKAGAEAFDRALNQCQHKTVIHGDAKADNFCFAKKPSGDCSSVVAVDFQYTGSGCGMKDVMCLLDSTLDPYEASGYVPDLLDHYFERLRAWCRQLNRDQDIDAVESEWRDLHPIAWADYYRFLDGWAPGRYPPQGYVDEMVSLAIQNVVSA